MKELEKLYDRIIQRVNINLRELEFDVNPLVTNLIPTQQMTKFYAFYGITPHHPLNLVFKNANLSGSYFLGKVRVTNSLLYKSDIRGDELKKQGDLFQYQEFNIPVDQDEEISIEDSFLIKTLVHCFSHDPESLEDFFIRDTVSMHYANIHGSPSDGCYLGPFSTVDLTTIRDCVVGAYSYVQAGEISHLQIDPGTIWVRKPGDFNFMYRYPLDQLNAYVNFAAGRPPQGIFMDFVDVRKEAFQPVYNMVNLDPPVTIPASASLDRFAVIQPKTKIGENVLVAQRAFLQNSILGKGANAQENCYIINSILKGNNVTAHGAKIIEADLDANVFVGFNSFLRGRSESRLSIGSRSIIMPHTIIDIQEALAIPEDYLVWGLIRNAADLESNSISLKAFSRIKTRACQGNMLFEGNGGSFVTAFQERIHHILETNGAFFNGDANRGHAQQNQNISFNTIQPYPKGGDKEGLYPTIIIQP